MSISKLFADDIQNVAKFEKFVLEVDNVGAGENASHQHFLPS